MTDRDEDEDVPETDRDLALLLALKRVEVGAAIQAHLQAAYLAASHAGARGLADQIMAITLPRDMWEGRLLRALGVEPERYEYVHPGAEVTADPLTVFERIESEGAP